MKTSPAGGKLIGGGLNLLRRQGLSRGETFRRWFSTELDQKMYAGVKTKDGKRLPAEADLLRPRTGRCWYHATIITLEGESYCLRERLKLVHISRPLDKRSQRVARS